MFFLKLSNLVYNDIVHAVNHVLFNMLIFIPFEKCCSICPFIPRRRKRRRKEKEKSSFIYTYYKEKKITHSLIHSFLLARKAVYKKEKRAKINGKY